MDVNALFEGASNIFLLQNIIAIILGITCGLIVGSIPAINGTLAIAVLLPFTFGLPLETGLLFLATLYKASNYSGSLASIMLGTPGTPAAAATLFDGYKLFKNNQGKKAIDMALYASSTASLAADLFLLVLVVPLTLVALKFGPPEVLILVLLSLVCVASLSEGSHGNILKNLLSGLTGLFIAMIGLDPLRGTSRYSFGSSELLGGINVIIVVIGLLCLPEIIIQIVKIRNKEDYLAKFKKITKGQEGVSLKEYIFALPSIIRGIIIGTIVGIMPGCGPTMATFLNYQYEHTLSARRKDAVRVGDGSLLGVSAPESANNAVAGTNLLPLISFGIPGDTAAAVLVGAFIMHGLNPGPTIMQRIPEVIYTLILGLLISNILLLFLGKVYNVIFQYIVALFKPTILYPLLLIISFAAAYTVNRTMMDLFLVIFIGFLGLFFIMGGFSRASMIIGVVLGSLAERSLGQTLTIGRGSLLVVFNRPISLLLILALIIIFIVPIIKRQIQNIRKKGDHQQNEIIP